MLSGQVEATRREDWHESANENCQYRTGASSNSQPQCFARLTVSGGKIWSRYQLYMQAHRLQMHR